MSAKKSKLQQKLLVFTSGGDSPGMNAAVRAVVRSGHYRGLKIYGCHGGYRGLVDRDLFVLEPQQVAGCIQHGGTILRSGRAKEFLQPEVRERTRQFLAEIGIDYLVAIGGDGTYRGAAILEMEGGPKAIGIPGTIDNDIVGTEYTIGYDTARNSAIAAIDKIRDTSASSGLYFLIETMGRRAGFLAVDVGIASGAEHILIPEFPVTVPELAKKILAPRRKKRSVIIVVSEADSPGRSFTIAQALKLLTPDHDYRVCVLGHTQRGGSPTALDRIAASIMGDLAVRGLLEGRSNCMTAIQQGQYVLAPFPDPAQPSRSIIARDLIELNEILAV